MNNPAIYKALDRFERLAGIYRTDRTDAAIALNSNPRIDWLRLLAADDDTFLADMIGHQQDRDGFVPVCISEINQ